MPSNDDRADSKVEREAPRDATRIGYVRVAPRSLSPFVAGQSAFFPRLAADIATRSHPSEKICRARQGKRHASAKQNNRHNKAVARF